MCKLCTLLAMTTQVQRIVTDNPFAPGYKLRFGSKDNRFAPEYKLGFGSKQIS